MADGDHIHGVIRATALNHGGKTNGYTVPNPTAQAEVIVAALRKSAIEPESIGYIEAHGTGTALGDPIEIAALSKAFAGRTRPCAIGSVKSNLGHLEAAAGIAGLTKILLQLRHQTLVPSLHSEPANPNIAFEDTPFQVQTAAATWPQPLDGMGRPLPRRAGLSAFGAGGANAHVIVEEFLPASAPAVAIADKPQVIVLSARDGERLAACAGRMVQYLEAQEAQGQPPALASLAFTTQMGREAMDERLAILAPNLPALRARLQSFCEGKPLTDGFAGNVRQGKAALSLISGGGVVDEVLNQLIQKRILRAWRGFGPLGWTSRGNGSTNRVRLPAFPCLPIPSLGSDAGWSFLLWR